MLNDFDWFIWIGTGDGLNRYDGLSFKVFRHIEKDSTSIPSNYIASIAEDIDKEHIWISTTDGYVAKIDKSSFTSSNYKPGAKSGLSGDQILNMFFDRNGNFWVCIASKGLYSFDKKKNIFNHVISLNDIAPFYSSDQMKTFNSINKIAEDEAGLFWMATTDGLYTYDPIKKKTQSIRSQPILSPDQIRNDLFVDILLGNDGAWLASTGGGLSHFNTKTKAWQNFRLNLSTTNSVNNISSLAWKNNT